MRFARWWFGMAFVYGMAAVLPLYFRAPVGAPNFYYGFAGAAGATQFAYLLIATDPARFRPVIPVGILSKLSFAIPCILFYARGALGRDMLLFAAIDLLLATGFAAAWALTGRSAAR